MRIPKPFFRKQTNSWYVQIGKKQHNLGPDEDAARTQYHLLMAGRQGADPDTTVVAIVASFLDWNNKHREEGTREFYSRPLLSFSKQIGDGLRVKELKPFHVTQWLDAAYAGKSDNYRRNAVRAVQRAFRWAEDEGYIDKSPVKTVKKPAATPRDTLISPEQWGLLEVALNSRGKSGSLFLDFLTVMRQTGCRPKEARDAEARHLDIKSRCLVFEREKSKGHGGGRTVERRVVPLTDAAFEICARCAKEYPNGQIFRNSVGQPWDRYQIKQWFKSLDGTRGRRGKAKRVRHERLGIHLTAYAIRHTWATEALERGVDPITVATIMGHKDLTQLMKTYQHLNRKSDHLRAMLHVAVGTLPASQSAANPQT